MCRLKRRWGLDFVLKGSGTDPVTTQTRLLAPPRLKTGALGGASAGMGPLPRLGNATMARAQNVKTRSGAFERTKSSVAAGAASRETNKAAAVISLLKSKRGATIPELMEATGWQSHSVRGFLAGALRSRHGLQPVSKKLDGELRRYRAR